MKKFALLLLTGLMTLQVQASCLSELQLMKKESYFSKMSENAQQGTAFVSSAGGLAIGLAVAGSTFPGFIIAAGIASSPILVGEAVKGIQNSPLNRMIKLIQQSQEFAANPSKKPGRLLRKLHKRLETSKIPRDISILELAMTISNANEDLANCGALTRFKKVDDKIKDGTLTVVELSEQ